MTLARKRGLRAAPLVLLMHGLGAAPLVYLMSSLAASPAYAQGSSVLTGKVIDASTKQPAADVVVTATSPALQGEQTVVTDGSGSFRIPNLPPGEYTLRMDKETYRPYSRGGIGVRVGATIFISSELLPERVTIKEEIEVVGKAPTVDVGSAQQSTSITTDFTSRIPVSRPSGKGGAVRSFESVAETAPGAANDTYGVSIAGTTSPENSYVVDGVRTNDTAYGTAGTPLSIEFVKEVSTITGGYLPEYGRATGGVIEAATKSGSNQFTGSVFFNVSPGAFDGPRTQVKSEGQTITTDRTVGNIRDFGFDLGGPIVKDKLWFYTGLDIAFTTWRLDRNLNKIRFSCSPYHPDGVPDLGCNPDKDPETGFTLTDKIPGTQRIYTAEEQSFQYIGKLTFAINQDNNLTLTVTGTPRFSGGDGTYGIGPRTGGPEVSNITGPYNAQAHRFTSITNDIALKYSTAFNQKKVLIDATFAWHHQEDGSGLPPDGSEPGTTEGLAGQSAVSYRRNALQDAVGVGPDGIYGTMDDEAGRLPGFHSINDFETVADPACEPAGATISRVCPVRGYTAGGVGQSAIRKLDRYQLKLMMTNLFEGLGHHVVKSGVDFEYMGYGLAKQYGGGIFYRETTGGTSFDDFRQYGLLVGPDDAVTFRSVKTSTASTALGAFVQDSWSILDKVQLNAGVRMDNEWIYNAQGGLGLAVPNQWSPRVGAIWDPSPLWNQAGRAKVYANYARYYESIPLDMADRSLSGETAIFSRHNAALCNPAIISQQQNECRLDSARRPHPFASSTTPDQFWTPTGAGKTPVDPDISPQSTDEFSIGAEVEVFANARVGLSYQKRWMNNVIEDMSRDEAATYFLGNPGSGIAADFPKAKRDYDAVTISFTKNFADQWQVIASYTWSYLRGNYAGLFRPETGQLDPNINSDFDLISLLDNRDGPLAGDTTHSIKVFGSKDFTFFKTWDLNLGLGFRAASGGPTNYIGSHAIYGPGEVFILPRGCGERLPWTFSIDPHIGVGYRLAKDSVVTLSMDIFNVFNFQAITGFDDRYTPVDVLPLSDPNITKLCEEGADKKDKDAAVDANLKRSDSTTAFDPAEKNPNFGNPSGYQAPRSFRFGAKVTF